MSQQFYHELGSLLTNEILVITVPDSW